MQCPDCGAYITEEDLFCGECGRPLAGKAPAAPSMPPAEAKDLPTDTIELSTQPPAAPAKTPRWVPLVAAAVVGIFALCLCGFGGLAWLGSRDASTPAPTVAAARPLLYAEDFGDAESGWDVFEEDDTAASYADGEYRLGIYRDNYVAWGNPSEGEFADFEVEVDARTLEGPLDNNFGVLVRYQPDAGEFYWFQISADGYYSVDRMTADEWVGLVDWQQSEAINQGLGATNHLKVVCDGTHFIFYVNGTYLTDVEDATYASGNVGLAAGTFDEPGVVVHFDNVNVYGPQE